MKTQSLLAYFFPKQRAVTKVPGRERHSRLGGSLRAATQIGRCPKEIFSGPATTVSMHRYHCTPDRSHPENLCSKPRWRWCSERSTEEPDLPTHPGLRAPAPHLTPELQWPPRAAQYPGKSTIWGLSNRVGLCVLRASFYFKSPTEEMGNTHHHVGIR